MKEYIMNDLTPIEISSITDMVKGMSKEQLKVAVKHVPIEIMCEEIAIRHKNLEEKIAGINSIMGVN
jgi:hypothetical protein